MINFFAGLFGFDDLVGLTIVLGIGFAYMWRRAGTTHRSKLSQVPAEQSGMGIRVGGTLVAWFADPDQAETWAQQNFFGQWLGHPCSIPDRPPFTEEQLSAARREGERLASKVRPSRVLEE